MYIDIKKAFFVVEKFNIVLNITNIVVDEILERAVYKFQCNLSKENFKVDIRWILSAKGLIYSYQLYTNKPLLRWDNAPHFPNIKTQPHHFHDEKNNVFESDLKGEIFSDLKIVFTHIEKFINKNYENIP